MDNQITHALMNNINFNDANSLRNLLKRVNQRLKLQVLINKCTDIKHLCKSFKNVKNGLCIDILNIVRLKLLISLEET